MFWRKKEKKKKIKKKYKLSFWGSHSYYTTSPDVEHITTCSKIGSSKITSCCVVNFKYVYIFPLPTPAIKGQIPFCEKRNLW